jgi:hypothetical protein
VVGSINGRSSLKIAHFVREIMARVIFLLTEEKIFLEINQSKTRIACGGHVWYGS